MTSVVAKDHAAKQQQKSNYNKHHRTRSSAVKSIGEEVWIPDIRNRATIIEVLPYRSYLMRTQSGRVVRRNSRAIRPLLPRLQGKQKPASTLLLDTPPIQLQQGRILDPSPPHVVQPTVQTITEQ